MKIGYVRSSFKENIDIQINSLKEVACNKIHIEISKDIYNLITLNKVLTSLKKGDTLIVWKLDRLAMNSNMLLEFLYLLNVKGVNFTSIVDSIKIQTTNEDLFVKHLNIMNTMNKKILSEKASFNLMKLKKQGKKIGRKSKVTKAKLELAKNLLEEGLSKEEIAFRINVSLSTLYRSLKS